MLASRMRIAAALLVCAAVSGCAAPPPAQPSPSAKPVLQQKRRVAIERRAPRVATGTVGFDTPKPKASFYWRPDPSGDGSYPIAVPASLPVSEVASIAAYAVRNHLGWDYLGPSGGLPQHPVLIGAIPIAVPSRSVFGTGAVAFDDLTTTDVYAVIVASRPSKTAGRSEFLLQRDPRNGRWVASPTHILYLADTVQAVRDLGGTDARLVVMNAPNLWLMWLAFRDADGAGHLMSVGAGSDPYHLETVDGRLIENGKLFPLEALRTPVGTAY